MQEAFRTALGELESKQQAPRFAPHQLQWLHTRIGTDPHQPTPLLPAQLAKLCYTGQKLGRHWASYTNPGGTQPRVLEQLRDEWTVLVPQAVMLPREQQAQVLGAL